MQGKTMLETLTWALASKPIIGWGTSFSVGILAFMEMATPYLQFTSLLLGISIGVLTLYWILNKRK